MQLSSCRDSKRRRKFFFFLSSSSSSFRVLHGGSTRLMSRLYLKEKKKEKGKEEDFSSSALSTNTYNQYTNLSFVYLALSTCLSVSLSVCLAIDSSASLACSVCLSISLRVSLSICLSPLYESSVVPPRMACMLPAGLRPTCTYTAQIDADRESASKTFLSRNRFEWGDTEA